VKAHIIFRTEHQLSKAGPGGFHRQNCLGCHPNQAGCSRARKLCDDLLYGCGNHVRRTNISFLLFLLGHPTRSRTKACFRLLGSDLVRV